MESPGTNVLQRRWRVSLFHPPQPGKTPQTESLQLHELNLIHSRLWQIALPDEHRRELARGAGFCGLSTTASIVPVSQQNGPCPAAIRNNFARTHARMYAHHASDAPSSLARSAASSASARVCNRSLCRSLCARNSWQYSQGQRHVARLFEPRCANRRRVSSPLKVYLTSSGACESSSAAAAVLQSAPKIFVYKCHLYTNVYKTNKQTPTHPHVMCVCCGVHSKLPQRSGAPAARDGASRRHSSSTRPLRRRRPPPTACSGFLVQAADAADLDGAPAAWP